MFSFEANQSLGDSDGVRNYYPRFIYCPPLSSSSPRYWIPPAAAAAARSLVAEEAIFTYGWRRSTCNGWQLNVICYVIPYAVVVLATVCGASNAIIMRDGTGWQYGQPLGEA